MAMKKMMQDKGTLGEEEGKTTLADIAETLERFGLSAEGFYAESFSGIDELQYPAIIPVYLEDERQYYAVYYGKFAQKYLRGLLKTTLLAQSSLRT